MADSEHCSSRGSSGWDITFMPGGEYLLKKHGQAHFFPNHDAVRNFLMGYETAHDLYNDEVGSGGVNMNGESASVNKLSDEATTT